MMDSASCYTGLQWGGTLLPGKHKGAIMNLNNLLRLVLGGLLLALALAASAEGMRVIYPKNESNADARNVYPIKVLELALAKAGGQYEVQPSKSVMQRTRQLSQLAEAQELDVVWSVTSAERERDFLPIRIPIDKGLLGWRICLVHKDNLAKLSDVQNLEQLKAFSAGQGKDWADVQILRANGLKVELGSTYDGLFQMLQAKRFDYFPRSVLEIWGELEKHPGMEFEVEPGLILQYPSAFYFFVNKNNTALAERIERGLRAAIKDGSFEKLFEQYNGPLIARANLRNRKHLMLTNPLLPEATPLKQKEFWLSQ
jgi:ABC-type amino acid transport substrate-binding protein